MENERPGGWSSHVTPKGVSRQEVALGPEGTQGLAASYGDLSLRSRNVMVKSHFLHIGH